MANVYSWPRSVVALLVLVFFATTVSAQQVVVTEEFVPGEVIVKLKGKSKSLGSQAFIGKAVSEKSMTLKGSWSGLNMHHFSLKSGQLVSKAVEELQNDPDVEYAEPNYILKRQSTGEVEGALVKMEDIYAGSGGYSAQAAVQTNAPIQLSSAWSAMTSGKTPPVVAVIDTGLDFNHDVFRNSGAIWTNPGEIASNGIDDDGNGYVDDVHGWNFVANTNNPQDDEGHGTHCAGIVLGTTQDIMASPIGAAKIRIMPLKFLDSNGSGTTSDAVKAIYYAVNSGAKVLSNSWGGGSYSNSLLDAIAFTYDQGRIFVAAAGNASQNNDAAPTYPASYGIPHVMSIAATSDLDAWASFSNYGVRSVHISSPGVSILSTYPGNTLARLSGTSMATPFVAGVAALMVREQPTMNGYQVKSLLFGASDRISSLVNKTSTQSRLDVYNSVVAAKSATVDSSLPSYDVNALRAPSSVASSSGSMVGGCGLVKALSDGAGSGGGGTGLSGPQKNLAFFGVLLIMVAPVLLGVAMRHRSGKGQRRYTRYQIDSTVRLRLGDKELVGQVSTISLGGVQLNTDAWLEKGGVVKMSIRSPDGRDEIEVEGKVVWSEEHKRYGVAFANANNSALNAIGRWTQSLLKA